MPMGIDFPTKIGNATKPPQSDTVDHIMGVTRPPNPAEPSTDKNKLLLLGAAGALIYFMYFRRK